MSHMSIIPIPYFQSRLCCFTRWWTKEAVLMAGWLDFQRIIQRSHFDLVLQSIPSDLISIVQLCSWMQLDGLGMKMSSDHIRRRSRPHVGDHGLIFSSLHKWIQPYKLDYRHCQHTSVCPLPLHRCQAVHPPRGELGVKSTDLRFSFSNGPGDISVPSNLFQDVRKHLFILVI